MPRFSLHPALSYAPIVLLAMSLVGGIHPAKATATDGLVYPSRGVGELPQLAHRQPQPRDGDSEAASPEASPDAAQGHHHHHTLDIPTGQPVPSLQLVVHPDAIQGWNLELQVTNFRFAPELINQANQPNTGHGHLYINGEKQGRVYGSWLHMPHLPPGRNDITVSLNANGHEALNNHGQPIAATVVIEVPE